MTANIPTKTGCSGQWPQLRTKALLFDAQMHRVSTGSSAPSDALTQIYRLQEATSFNGPEFFAGYLGTSMLKLSKSASRINRVITHIASGFTMQLALPLTANGVFERSSLGREEHSNDSGETPFFRASCQTTRQLLNQTYE